MKKYKYIILFAFLVSVLGSCGPSLFESLWQEKPVTVDGIANEWSVPLRLYDYKSTLNYTFSNDEKNIYVCIRATVDQMQKKIFRSGIQLWIDTLGKKNKTTGILFPLRKSGNESWNKLSGQRRDTLGIGQKSYSSSTAYNMNEGFEIRISGIKSSADGLIPMKNGLGIEMHIRRDSSNCLFYEAAIPFAAFYKPLLTKADSNKVFSVGIIINALPDGAQGGGGYAGAGGHHGGGGNGRGGNNGSGGYNDDQNGMDNNGSMNNGSEGMKNSNGGYMSTSNRTSNNTATDTRTGMDSARYMGGRSGSGNSVQVSALYETNTLWMKFHPSVKKIKRLN